jgi:hypothetical protein
MTSIEYGPQQVLRAGVRCLTRRALRNWGHSMHLLRRPPTIIPIRHIDLAAREDRKAGRVHKG